ncbi:MAG: carboxypeptidase-like regulatory domain-containing protein [Bryobacteraceae bacterium]
MRHSSNVTVVTLLVVLGLALPCLRAQDNASVSGLVTDASGAAIDSAAITLKSLENGSTRSGLSDQSGRYSFPSLHVGRYSIAAEKPGFQVVSKTGILLVLGQQAEVNLRLPVGELSQVVTVEAAEQVVSLSTSQTSGLVTEQEVKNLPLNGRSYDELMTLNPGVVNYSSERGGSIGTSNSALGNMFSVSGRRPQESLFLLNGIEYTSASEINLTPGGASGQLLGVDAVREFNVVSDVYGAEYGKRPGGQVSILTTSGSNQIHGSLYEFLRNSALDARNFYDQATIAPFERNEFGGALGGPIQKDKTFIFGNYEGFRQRLGLSDVTLVPDNNARNGYLPNSSGKLVYVGLGKGVAPLLTLWPVQNGPELGGGIAIAYSNPLQHITEDFGTTRVDHVFSAKDQLSGVYTIDDSADRTPSANPLTGIAENEIAQVFSLEESHVFSPRVLNTARFGFSRGDMNFAGVVAGNVPGWIGSNPVGAIVIGGGTSSNSATQVTQAGANVASNTTAVRNLFTYTDQVDVNLGIHHIQAGAWVQRIQSNDNFAQAQYGQASFSTLLSFLQGKITTFTAVPTPTALGWRSLEAAWFVQDTIKLRPNLEVKLGFRAESTDGWNESHGRGSNYLFGPGGVIETQPQIANSVFTVNRATFLPEPRVGLAWDPFGHSNTVIHAGFGMYNALLDNLSYRLDQNAPFNTTIALKNITVGSLVPGAPLPSGGLVSPAGVQPDAYTPTVLSWVFKVDQKISANTSLGIGYVGSHGYHEILSVDGNLPFQTVCPASPCPPSLPPGTIYYPKGSPLANPNVANTTSWFTEGLSSYNALQLDVNRRLTNGLQIRGVYTFSKSLDDGGTLNNSVGNNTPAFVAFPLNPKADWGRSPFNVTNLGAINGTYELPFGKGRAFMRSESRLVDTFVGGWQISGVVTAQSGFPFTPQLGFNPSNDGDSRNPVRPSWNPAFTGPVILDGPNQYFNPNAFVVPPNGTYGNAGRDVLTGPGLTTVDFSALKNTAITERVNLQFRAEFFNILNHTNFNTPNPVVFTAATGGPVSTAGVISSTATTSRQIQFGLKLLF